MSVVQQSLRSLPWTNRERVPVGRMTPVPSEGMVRWTVCDPAPVLFSRLRRM
jgi:hypothetical protein